MRLTKISASGNDFLIFHTLRNGDFSFMAKKLCHRQQGIGADGLIVLVPSVLADFGWNFYNSDGSIAKMCGNGARAAAFYAFENHLAGTSQRLETLAGIITTRVKDDTVKVKFANFKILEKNDEFRIFDTGVKHFVKKVQDLGEFHEKTARELRQKFDANVNFYVQDKDILMLRTYEKGVEGETLACGTGMAACFLDAFGLKDGAMDVVPASGKKLRLSLQKGELFLEGKVIKIADMFVSVKDLIDKV